MLAVRKERRLGEQPLAVLGLTDAALAEATAKLLRAEGWSVMVAITAAEVRRAASRLAANVVILDVDPPDESGWLTCAKLIRLRCRPKVILVDADPAPTRDDFARFVGAVGRVASPVTAKRLAKLAGQFAPASV